MADGVMEDFIRATGVGGPGSTPALIAAQARRFVKHGRSLHRLGWGAGGTAPSRVLLGVVLLCSSLLLARPLAAYEVHYAPTGYQVTSGMDYAIRYEIKQLIAKHEAAFKRKVPADFQVTYRIFPTRERYLEYNAESKRPSDAKVLGYTKSSARIRRDNGEIVAARAEIVTWKHEQPAVLLTTVLHETTHAVTQAVLLNVPLWMVEGSADWFAKPAWAESDAQKLDRAQRWLALKQQLDEKKLPPLRPYLEADEYAEWAKLLGGNIGMGYVIGYSLFDFFISSPQAETFLTTLLKSPAVEKGDRPGAAFTAFLDKNWRGGLAAFETGWHNWIRSRAAVQKSPPAKAAPKQK